MDLKVPNLSNTNTSNGIPWNVVEVDSEQSGTK